MYTYGHSLSPHYALPSSAKGHVEGLDDVLEAVAGRRRTMVEGAGRDDPPLRHLHQLRVHADQDVRRQPLGFVVDRLELPEVGLQDEIRPQDRKSTRLNSSH